MLALKTLAHAIEDGDRILGVLRGSAVNQDGRSSGLTAPSGVAQEALIATALADAGLSPRDVSYVEAHGTGTRLGDPIEMRALQAVFGDRPAADPLRVGSVKTNIGHLEAAAGVASIIKVLTSLEHETIPAHLNLETPNPAIDWSAAPIEVPLQAVAWPRGERPRVAGVSAFAFSGTNVHLVVEEPPAAPAREPSARQAHLIVLSARTADALHATAERLAADLANHPQPLEDVAFTMNAGRARLEHRAALVATSTADAAARLATFGPEGAMAVGVENGVTGADAPRLAFLYTGQGAQAPGMGRDLFESQPIFRAAIEACDAHLGPIQGARLCDWLYGDVPDAEAAFQQTGLAQPALFAIEYALTELWKSWGIQPTAVIGHSVGEIAAACAAGVLSLEDAATLVAARGRLMQALPAGGGMRAVRAGRAQVADIVGAAGDLQVWIAGINAPDETVVAGTIDDLERFDARCRTGGLSSAPLHVSHAFHTPLMSPMVDELGAVAQTMTVRAPVLRLISTVTSRPVSATTPMDADYWRRQVLSPVAFCTAIQELARAGYDTFVEVGPHPVLAGLGRRSVPAPGCVWLGSLRRGRPDWLQIQGTLGALFTRGFDFDGRALAIPDRPRRVVLPGQPFERRRYWVDAYQGTAVPEFGGGVSADSTVAIQSAISGERLSQQTIDPDRDVVATDHQVFGHAIYPAAGFLAQLVCAAADVRPDAAVEVRDFTVLRPLVFSTGQPQLVQAILSGQDAPLSGTVFSAPAATHGDDREWTRHASGAAAFTDAVTAEETVVPAPGEPRVDEVAGLYSDLVGRGIAHGAGYRLVEAVHSNAGRTIGRLRPPAVADRTSALAIRIDSALQVLAGALQSVFHGSPGTTWLPMSIGRLSIDPRVAVDMPCRAIARSRLDWTDDSTETTIGDVWCYDESDRLVLVAENCVSRLASPDALRRLAPDETEAWLHEIAWRAAADAPSETTPRTWLVAGNPGGLGVALADRLNARRAPDDPTPPARVVERGEVTDALQALDAAGGARATVVDLCAVAPDGATPDATAETAVDELLAVAHRLVDPSMAVRADLVIVTRDATAPSAVSAAGLAGAAVTAFGRVLAQEHPDIDVRTIDVEASANDDVVADALADELSRAPAEPVVAIRDGQRWVPRLTRAARRSALTVPSGSYALSVGQRGTLDQLRFAAAPDPLPAAGEVQVRVAVSALNFRDVLNALGMLPGPERPIGSEFVGEVTAVGEGVTGIAPGEMVMGIAAEGFRSAITIPAPLVARVPDALTLEAAATIPTTYLTAWYALMEIAQLRAGERVLIHAAAGGVGLAAVHLARMIGAEVFATAGTDAKRAYLRSLGVRHIWDSRSPTFADGIKAASGGAGVDVILNSLTGPFIPANFEALAPHGRFVEIGKTEIWTDAQVRAAHSTATYVVFDLGEPIRERPQEVGARLQSIVAAIDAGRLPALPARAFALGEIRDAFRFMAQAKHTGKIVLRHPGAGAPRANGTYLVTGGLGGVGLTLAEDLASRGARHLVLLGRSAPGPRAAEAIARLEAAGVSVRVAAADVSDEATMARVLSAIPADRPLRGIVHAAGALDDGVVQQMTPERIARVFLPKVRGAWVLHALTREAPLDFFVLCSSVAAVFGSAGQSNYAAANAWLDALARARAAEGRAALSVNWGAWSDVGMATRVSDAFRERWAAQGFQLIPPARGGAALWRALDGGFVQAIVQPANWTTFGRALGRRPVPKVLSELVRQSQGPARAAGGSARDENIRAALASAAPAERATRLREHIRHQVADVLGLDSSAVLKDDQPLTELGIDSLMAVELSNRLKTSLGQSLAPTLAFEFPTLGGLTAHLLERVDGDAAAAASPESLDAMVSAVSSLDEAAVDDLLDQLEPSEDVPGR
jgi:acyl transferase domain-containing protein